MSTTGKAPSAKEVMFEKYMSDLKEKVGEAKPDVALLEACIKACGPSIYRADAATVAASDKAEVERVLKNFVEKRLGVTDEAKAAAAFKAAVEKYGRAVRQKHRPVMYYLIAKELRKAAALKNA
ncbi:DUF2853 family protein [Hyphomonas sp.]|uniref:DUF2853 family protein n=1 Tax=Hyphomonas sp. TaxID=87 RepID=UPI003918C7F9